MSAVETVAVAPDEAEMRLDRWFRRRYPQLSQGQIQKLLRTGQVRVDGKRAKANDRLHAGEQVRVPPLPDSGGKASPKSAGKGRPVDAALAETLASRVLYRDDEILAVDKPPGLATQGGSGIDRHLDGALGGLKFEASEAPRLVHRLDKDTSGVLLLARTAAAARWMARAFRGRDVEKLYWAITIGVPEPADGIIKAPLIKAAKTGAALGAAEREKMVVDVEAGARSVTRYTVVDSAGNRAAWVALVPETGRTHQLRAHLEYLGTPIQGDGKYGLRENFLVGDGLSRKLHLHARRVSLEKPNGRRLTITAPLPDHMRRSWEFLGFDEVEGEAEEAQP